MLHSSIGIGIIACGRAGMIHVRNFARLVPMGAAMLAGMGTGIFPSLPVATERWVRLGRRFTPTAALAAHYQSRIARYEALLHALNDWAARP